MPFRVRSESAREGKAERGWPHGRHLPPPGRSLEQQPRAPTTDRPTCAQDPPGPSGRAHPVGPIRPPRLPLPAAAASAAAAASPWPAADRPGRWCEASGADGCGGAWGTASSSASPTPPTPPAQDRADDQRRRSVLLRAPRAAPRRHRRCGGPRVKPAGPTDSVASAPVLPARVIPRHALRESPSGAAARREQQRVRWVRCRNARAARQGGCGAGAVRAQCGVRGHGNKPCPRLPSQGAIQAQPWMGA